MSDLACVAGVQRGARLPPPFPLSLCVSKLNLFVSIGTSLGRCTVRCHIFYPNLSFEIRGAAYLRVRLIHECLRYFLCVWKQGHAAPVNLDL